jgi:Tol biopolymer transport system component
VLAGILGEQALTPAGEPAEKGVTMNSRILRLGLVVVAAAVVIALIVTLRSASDSGAQVTSGAVPSASPGATLGKLAYELNGDIYLANGDGGDPVRIADGRPDNNSGRRTYWGPVWSPDGRYLAYLSSSHGGTRNVVLASRIRTTVYVSDPEGHLVASFTKKYYWGAFSWSPDSKRIATWLSRVSMGPYRIGIYGLDGVRQKLLTTPRGFRGVDGVPVWTPDMASLLAPTGGAIVPVDGRRSYRLPASDSRSRGWIWYSPDGTRVATTRQWAIPAPLFIAAADGSQARELVSGRVENAVWSPAGDRIAFDSPTGTAPTAWWGSDTRLRVVDVASGMVTTLTDAGAGDRAIRFSPDGRRILFSRTGPKGVSALWSIAADGSDAHRLVQGVSGGDWQPLSPRQ